MPITLDGTLGITTPALTVTGSSTFTSGSFTNLAYTGTLTGGTGIVNLGSGQFYKDASGNVGIGTSSPSGGTLAVLANSFACSYNAIGRASDNLSLIRFSNNANTTDYAYIGPAAANTLAFYTNGYTERMRIDSSGNVGIGTSSPAYRLDVQAAAVVAKVTSTTGTNYAIYQAANTSGVLNIGLESSTGGTILTGTSAYSGIVATSGAYPLAFGTNNTERMRIDSSGNVGIGTSSPNSYGAGYTTAQVNGSSGGLLQATVGGSTIIGELYASQGLGLVQVGTRTNHPLAFKTNSTEAMRIDSSGNLLVGTTTSASSRLTVDTAATGGLYGLYVTGFGYGVSAGGIFNATATIPSGGNADVLYFAYKGTTAGSVTLTNTGTQTAYVTTSDYRLKENIAPMKGALDTVSKLKPVTYDWKVGGSSQGFIAHELQAIVPDCVTGEKDAVDEEGNPKYQGIDTSFLVATLTAAIQEQQALIESLTTRLTTLEAK